MAGEPERADERRFRVVLEPGGWSFDAPASASLLRAAELAGYRLPSSCRNGTCRACICRMSEGEARYEIEWPGLSSDEKRDGYILPCVAHPESDIVMSVPGAMAIGKPPCK